MYMCLVLVPHRHNAVATVTAVVAVVDVEDDCSKSSSLSVPHSLSVFLAPVSVGKNCFIESNAFLLWLYSLYVKCSHSFVCMLSLCVWHGEMMIHGAHTMNHEHADENGREQETEQNIKMKRAADGMALSD